MVLLECFEKMSEDALFSDSISKYIDVFGDGEFEALKSSDSMVLRKLISGSNSFADMSRGFGMPDMSRVAHC